LLSGFAVGFCSFETYFDVSFFWVEWVIAAFALFKLELLNFEFVQSKIGYVEFDFSNLFSFGCFYLHYGQQFFFWELGLLIYFDRRANLKMRIKYCCFIITI
jgi:hypothetical protein